MFRIKKVPMCECLKSEQNSWQDLYRAALFEADKTKTAERIAHAERVIVARARNLFNATSNAWAERSALDAALYALGVLKVYTSARDRNNQPSRMQSFQRNA